MATVTNSQINIPLSEIDKMLFSDQVYDMYQTLFDKWNDKKIEEFNYQEHLFQSPSMLKDAGWGVYTNIDIPKNVIITEYVGNRSAMKNKIYSKNAELYVFTTPANVHILPSKSCIARNINDNVDIDKSKTFHQVIRHSNIHHNVEWYIPKDLTKKATQLKVSLKNYQFNKQFIYTEKVYIKTKKDIKKGEELYIDYDDGYWEKKII